MINVNQFRATLRWTPPTVDWEEVEEEVAISGGDAATVRQMLQGRIRQIEKSSGWACELTLRPLLQKV